MDRYTEFLVHDQARRLQELARSRSGFPSAPAGARVRYRRRRRSRAPSTD